MATRRRRGPRRGTEPEEVPPLPLAAQRISCTVRQFTPVVLDQGEENNCGIIQFTDMIATAFRMSGIMVLLSPQSLLNAGYSSTRLIRLGLAIGLFELGTLPFATIRIAPHPQLGEQNNLFIEGERRYRVGLDSMETPEDIKRAILVNFGPDGPHFPLAGSLLMGDLENSDVAVHAYDYMPFRHEEGPDDEEDDGERDLHTLLIVGVDTTYEDPRRHFCLVKNCWGEEWGKGGFTKVAFEVFLELDMPTLDDDVASLISVD